MHVSFLFVNMLIILCDYKQTGVLRPFFLNNIMLSFMQKLVLLKMTLQDIAFSYPVSFSLRYTNNISFTWSIIFYPFHGVMF